MEVSNIIYYTRQNEKSRTLSLRNLCLKETYNCGLQAIFYAVRNSVDAQDLLTNLQKICHEKIEFECENPGYIRFTVIDASGNKNHLKLKKSNEEIAYEND